MSVLNDMLRDLDRRGAGDDLRVFAQHVRPVDGRRAGFWRPVALVAGALVAIAVAAHPSLSRPPAAPLAPPLPLEGIAPASPPDLARATSAIPPRVPKVKTRSTKATAAKKPATTRGASVAEAKAKAKTAQRSMAAARGTTVPVPAPLATPSTAAPVAPSAAAEAAPQALPGGAPRIDKKELDGSRPTADGEFKRAVALLNQGRTEESRAALRAGLALDPRHAAARQTLAAILIESRSLDEAESVLAEGLRLHPGQANFAIVLARLKLDRGDASDAHVVLRDHGGAQAGNAEYRAFHAAVLRRLGRPAEAIVEYQAALKVAPGAGVWWLGLGLAQEAVERPDEAMEAFRRARGSGTLSPNLVAFVEQRLKAAP